MKYFHLDFTAHMDASESIWADQDASGQSRSNFRISAEGMDTWVWTEDPDHEQLYRETLQTQGASFQEQDERPDFGLLGNTFHNSLDRNRG